MSYNLGNMKEQGTATDIDKLIAILGDLPEPLAKPHFVIVSGLPGTGKSTFSRRLSQRLSSAIIETDALRKIVFPNPRYTIDESNQLFRVCHNLIRELLRRGIPVILDATNLLERHREYLYNIAERVGAKLIIVRVEAPPEFVQQRLVRRFVETDPDDHSDATWDIYMKMRAMAQKISRNHFVADTSKDVEPVIDKIVRELRR